MKKIGLAADPTEPIAAALRAREFDKAVELTRSALKASPGSAPLWTLQGIAFAGKGDDKQALASFQQALKIAPRNVAALAGAAQIAYEAGSSGGRTAARAPAGAAPRRSDCSRHAGGARVPEGRLQGHAVCLARLGRIDDAAAALQRSLVLRPDDPQERT